MSPLMQASAQKIQNLQSLARFIKYKTIPSKALSLYVMRLFIVRFFVLLLILTTILQALDLLNRSDDILNALHSLADNNTLEAEKNALWQYIIWRAPEIFSQFLPFSVLLAALSSFYSLAQSSEITIMRASGLAPLQITAPLLLACSFIGVFHLFFHDQITVPASLKLAYWRDNGYQTSNPPPDNSQPEIWLNDRHELIEIRLATRMGDQLILDHVSSYKRGETGLLSMAKEAEFALRDDKGWRLYNVSVFDLDQHSHLFYESLEWDFNLPEDQIFARTERPEHVQLAALKNAVQVTELAGSANFNLKTNLYHRFASALTSLIMPLIAAFVGFSLPRGGARIGRALLGLGLGFSYFILDNYLVAMGSLGAIPPLLAAYASFAIFGLAAFGMILRLD